MAETNVEKKMEFEEASTSKRITVCSTKRMIVAVVIFFIILFTVIGLTVYLVTARSRNDKATKPKESPPINTTGAEEASNPAITCSFVNLPDVTNGSFECATDSNVSKGEACILRCNDGFYPSYSNQTVCDVGPTNQEGRWSDGSFVCHAITCSTIDLPTVTNGSFDCAADHNISKVSKGEACTVRCNDGFYAPYSNQAVCEVGPTNQTGKWSDGSFVCHECYKWNQWNGNEYKVFSSRLKWDESRQLCEADSSHLVTIDNEEENQFVFKMVSDCRRASNWLGLNDIDVEGTWEWSNGAVSEYRNWNDGHPQADDMLDCAVMFVQGKWNSGYCLFKHNTICERISSIIK